ncbi:MAG: hypothetical protein FWH52_06960, partial [Synergistaceae bacterium]|nr:hypothetical protein [Synergistaceae bacterium]
TNREIAQKYDVSTSSACSARFRLGMSRLKKDLSFIDQYLGALSDAEIARKFGIKEKAVCYHRRYYKHKNKPV